MSPKSRTILTDATNQFKNGIRRMRSTQFDRPLAKGKENYPSPPPMPSAATTPPLPSQTTDADPHRWDPVNGMIVIKVSVPATDDIWRLRVAEAISLRAFRAKVELKVGFAVAFMDREPGGRQIVSEEAFKRWIAGRVRNGRNHPIIVVRKQQAFILNPSTPTSPLSPTLPTTPMTPITPTMPYMPTSNLSVWSP
ncbi:hypothetical protein PsYK624_024980 [Phanerochaete sordida]|uniref:Uncharacterized protein n=1 Tax=Phanerochaete sordida TaxID=48140 RepID=A0A9P3G005_9APHY|nr:hypothetical protein PsYK624_024980 [Phanerochaete sordida]